jgi:hypothetical protein
MRDRPIFDSQHPDDAKLSPEEQAAVEDGMRRRRELQAAEDAIPELSPGAVAAPRLGTTRAERTAARETFAQEQARASFISIMENSPWRSDELKGQVVRGEWIFYWPPVIEQMKREGRLSEALELALECSDCAARTLGHGPMWGWTEKVAIIARKMRRYDFEVEVIEGFLATAWHPDAEDGARRRLAKARALRDAGR